MPEHQPYSTGGIMALVVIGLLLLIPSGLCSAVMGGAAIWAAFTEPQNAGDAFSIVPMIAIFGGPFILGGGAMLFAGIRRARANRNAAPPA